MDIGFDSHLAQVQKTAITQKLIEHLEILQMTSLDLSQHIDEMLSTNPLLECDIPEHDKNREELPGKNRDENTCKFANTIPQVSQYGDDFLSYAKLAVTLKDYLKYQLLELCVHIKYKKITDYLIENLDSDGYLRENIYELSDILQISESSIEYSLKILQSLEPAGVGARDIKECLFLQLKRKKLLDCRIENIISHCLDLLASRNFLKISRETGIERKEVEQIYNLIKTLNPKPGCTFKKNEWEQCIVPDLILSQEDGIYILQFNNASIPSLRVNNYYVDLMRSSESSREVRDYIKRNLSNAEWLVKAIEQRETTLLNVANCIVACQKNFFEKGSEYLEPLTMKMVADSLEIHISTVSRTVSGKYIQTPKGVFPLKFFFSSTVEAESENKKSAVSVKNMIRRIILEEDKSRPLSDEQIKGRLELESVKVARRTIAKYREELSILPAAIRKC